MEYKPEDLQSVVDNVATDISVWQTSTPSWEYQLLMEALKSNTSVHSLDITFNSYNELLLTDVLNTNKTLTKLVLTETDSLKGYNLSSIDNLLIGLAANKSIISLEFKACHCLRDKITELADIVGSKSHLTEFEFENFPSEVECHKNVFSRAFLQHSQCKNLVYFSGANEELAKRIEENKEIALQLLDKIFSAIHMGAGYVMDVLPQIHERLPAIITVARKEKGQTEEQIRQFITPIKVLIAEEGADKIQPKAESPGVKSSAAPYKPKISPAEIRAQLKARSGVRLGLAEF